MSPHFDPPYTSRDSDAEMGRYDGGGWNPRANRRPGPPELGRPGLPPTPGRSSQTHAEAANDVELAFFLGSFAVLLFIVGVFAWWLS